MSNRLFSFLQCETAKSVPVIRKPVEESVPVPRKPEEEITRPKETKLYFTKEYLYIRKTNLFDPSDSSYYEDIEAFPLDKITHISSDTAYNRHNIRIKTVGDNKMTYVYNITNPIYIVKKEDEEATKGIRKCFGLVDFGL